MGYKRIPTQIVVAAFTEPDGAEKCLKRLAEAVKTGDAPICTNAAIATKNEAGKTSVKELGKPTLVKGLVGGTAAGGAVGALIGGSALSLLGPLGVATGAVAGGAVGAPIGMVNGAVVGSMGKIFVDGMDKDKLSNLKTSLEPNTSALVLVFAEVIVPERKYKDQLKEFKVNSDAFAHALCEDIHANLSQGRNCAHLYAVTDDGLVAERVVVGDDVMSLHMVILGHDAAAAAEFVATSEGVEAQAAVVTEDAVLAEGVVVTDQAAMAYEFEAEKE